MRFRPQRSMAAVRCRYNHQKEVATYVGVLMLSCCCLLTVTEIMFLQIGALPGFCLAVLWCVSRRTSSGDFTDKSSGGRHYAAQSRLDAGDLQLHPLLHDQPCHSPHTAEIISLTVMRHSMQNTTGIYSKLHRLCLVASDAYMMGTPTFYHESHLHDHRSLTRSQAYYVIRCIQDDAVSSLHCIPPDIWSVGNTSYASGILQL